MNIIDVEQRSQAWHTVRLGKVTASRIADVVAKTKSGAAASRANYMAELIAERLTGVPAQRFTNAAMEWGVEKEAEARAIYEFDAGVSVDPVGFVIHPDLPDAGCSPDGFVGEHGLVEIKCPNTATHLETLLKGADSVPMKYIYQMQWQAACTNRWWCDFVSYDPRLPERMKLKTIRIMRDDDLIDTIEAAVRDFLSEMNAKIEALIDAFPERETA